MRRRARPPWLASPKAGGARKDRYLGLSFDLAQSSDPLDVHIATMTRIIFASLPYFTVVGAFAYFFYQGIQ
jgi:hypothetical protein